MHSIFAVELSAGLAGAALVLALAYSGQGVWSLMLGWLASNLLQQAGFALVARDAYLGPGSAWPPSGPCWAMAPGARSSSPPGWS